MLESRTVWCGPNWRRNSRHPKYWHHRDIAVHSATRTVEVCPAEATCDRVFIAVEPAVDGVGAPVEHPERPRRAGMRVSKIMRRLRTRLCANKRINLQNRIVLSKSYSRKNEDRSKSCPD